MLEITCIGGLYFIFGGAKDHLKEKTVYLLYSLSIKIAWYPEEFVIFLVFKKINKLTNTAY